MGYYKFVYMVVNELTLSEFKKYTNFPEIMKNALMKKDEIDQQQLDYFVDRNFEVNIPIEALWKSGAFGRLKLENNFYETEAAQRAFHNIYGVKKCFVNLTKIHYKAQQEDRTGPSNIAAPSPLQRQCEDVTPENGNDISTLVINMRRVYNAQMLDSKHKFETYLVNIPAINWSLKNFWTEQQKSKHQKDSDLQNLASIAMAGILVPGSEMLQNQSSIDAADDQPANENSNDISSLLNNIRNAYNAQVLVSQREFEIYLVNISAINWSLKHFWTLLQKSKHHNSDLRTTSDTGIQNQASIEIAGILVPGNEMVQNQSSIYVADDQPANGNVCIVHTVESSDTIADIKIKLEKVSESNTSFGSDVEIIDVPHDSPIEIKDVNTQGAMNNFNAERGLKRPATSKSCNVTTVTEWRTSKRTKKHTLKMAEYLRK